MVKVGEIVRRGIEGEEEKHLHSSGFKLPDITQKAKANYNQESVNITMK